MIISEGPSEELKRTAAMQAGWHSSAWLCWPHPSPICIILIILCLSIPAWSIPCQFTGQVLWRWVLCGFPLCSDAWATRAQLMFSQAWTPWQPRGAICAKLQRQPGIRTPSLKKLWLIAAERKSAKSMHKKNRNSRSLVQTYTSFVRVPLMSKWPLVSAMGFHEIQQNSHQEDKNQTVFFGTSSRTHLSANLLFSWSCTGRSALQLLLFINYPISAVWWHLHPDRGTRTRISQGSPDPLPASQWGKAPTLNTDLDFCNTQSFICLSTVNPHVLSVSFAFYFGKKKYKTQCKIQIGLGSTFCIRLPQNLRQLFAKLSPCSPKFSGTSGVSQFWIKPDDSSLSKDSQKPIKQICKRIKWRKLFWTQNRILCNTEIVLFPNFLSWEGQKVDSFCLRTTLWLCWWQPLEIERQERFLGAVGSFCTHERQGLSCARWGEGLETTPGLGAPSEPHCRPKGFTSQHQKL